MELMVISSPDDVADESIIINQLFQSGLKYLHIRKPGSNITAVRELMNGIAPRFYNRISLHQFHEVADDYGIKRLHYTERARIELNEQKWQLQLDKGYILTTSIHNTALLPLLTGFEYIFYGPVFDSISKIGYRSNVPPGFKLDKDNTMGKVIALGGIEASNLAEVRAMGFDGAAVLGTIWNEPDKAISRFNKLMENLPCLNKI
ncbi:MAG TPA: thiamine phosphate synthase [Mucilaginibacter sp.]|jgi:thiamine-phosphate pyrophosphorylase